MKNDKIIRKNPLFEFYVENDHLVIRNDDYIKDNCLVALNSISHLELIRSLSFFDKIIEFTFGFWQKSKSDVLRIHLKNGHKDIVLTNCNIKKTELVINEVNLLILEVENNTKPI